MNVEEIKAAVDAGTPVCWINPGYLVIKDRLGQYLIRYIYTDYCIGLTHQDGVTLNGNPDEFRIVE